VLANRSERANDLQQTGIVARYELLKHFRRRRIYSVVVIAALIGVLQLVVPLAYNIPFPQQAKEWASSFLSFAGFLIIIVGAFFAGDAISSEFELKTGYIVFANPVKRSSIVLGKFAAAFLSSLITIGFYYLIGTSALLGIYGSVPIEVAASLGYACLYLCCVLGFTFLFSALLKGSIGATLLSFFMFLLIFSIVSQVISITGNEPWFLPSYASGMITQVINPQNDTIIVVPGSSVRFHTFYPKFPASLIVLAGYFVATLALSVVVTKRKEMA
jgi:ABC-2 type transport system permease protein